MSQTIDVPSDVVRVEELTDGAQVNTYLAGGALLLGAAVDPYGSPHYIVGVRQPRDYVDVFIHGCVDDLTNIVEAEIVGVRLAKCSPYHLGELDRALHSLDVDMDLPEGARNGEVYRFTVQWDNGDPDVGLAPYYDLSNPVRISAAPE